MRFAMTRRFLSLPLAYALTTLAAGCAGPMAPYPPALTIAHSTIGGRVMTPSGSPAAGVSLALFPAGYRPGDQAYGALSDADGRFSLSVPAGEYSLVAHGTAGMKVIRRVLAASMLHVDLAPTGMLQGTIAAPGAPSLAGAWVYVPGTNLIAVTDASGAYSLGNVPVGTTGVTAQLAGFAPVASSDATVEAGETTTIPTITLSTVIPPLVGPAGATGATGATGAMGDTGAMGATGPQGEIGATGAIGPQGPIGATGAMGATGSVGATGATGAMGPQGPSGATGAMGATGSVGATGATGAMGPQGPIGATGATGATGAQGAPIAYQGTYAAGTTYAVGDAVFYSGSSYISLTSGNIGNAPDITPAHWGLLAQQGVAGIIGATGATGPAGATGATGAIGPVGPAGAKGATGAIGAVGPQGPIGATGPAGAVGAVGPQGPAGVLVSTSITVNGQTLSADSQIVYVTGAYLFRLPANPSLGQVLHIFTDSTAATVDPNGKPIRAGGINYTAVSTMSEIYIPTTGRGASLMYNGTYWFSF
jgi:hypothetical protein